jgi:aryl-alcohol dehydrogenase-like predicted oxidoreductase
VQTVRLGRTGLDVSVVGLGCGGHSRLGLATGHDEAHATRVVAAALDHGIDFIDTARAYGTERAVGQALRGRRDRVVLSTKVSPGFGTELLTAAGLRESLEKSLARLGTDYVDVFHLHGVLATQYDHCVAELLPELERLRQAGKIRFIGVTERFGQDTGHGMLTRALADDHFDVVMVGHNLLNPSARRRVFPLTRGHDVGTLVMFAVRGALTDAARARVVVEHLIATGQVEAAAVDRSDPLGFLTAHPDVASLTAAAYRFCRHEPGAHVILTGTGNVAHLEANIASILAPALSEELLVRLDEIFGAVDSVSGD